MSRHSLTEEEEDSVSEPHAPQLGAGREAGEYKFALYVAQMKPRGKLHDVVSSSTIVANSKFRQMILLGALQLGLVVAASASLVATDSAWLHRTDLQCTVNGTTSADGLAFDEKILLEFKGLISDRADGLGNWGQNSTSVCNWTGVTCDGQRNRVSKISLPSYRLAGPLTPALGCLEYLQTINITNNSLNGSIPSGLFRKGSSLTPRSKYLIAIAAAAAAFVCSVASIVWSYCSEQKKPQDVQVREVAAWNGADLEVIRLTVEDLLKATDSFSDESIIGSGSSGTVHKGVLPTFPFVIALKKFSDGEEGRGRLDREARIMKLIRHRNLVRSLGARTCTSTELRCQPSGSFNKNKKNKKLKSTQLRCQVPRRLNVLVLEYMENGTLDNLLYGDDPSQDFGWETRVNIAVDVATGLCYLHEDIGNNVQLIHGDIKPANIFLNSGFEASIGDFGLSRLAVNGKVRDQTAERHWEGTFGYCPPELGQAYMSTAGDVFGLGVVILEMLVRRRPTSFTSEDSGVTFVSWIRKSFPHDLKEVIDLALMPELESDNEQVTFLFKVGLLCTADSPWDRPSAREALAMINSMSSRIKPKSEQEKTVSSIHELVQEQPDFVKDAQLRNAQSLKTLAERFDMDFSIDIYDHDGLRRNYILYSGSCCLSALYRSSRSVERRSEELEVTHDSEIKT